MAAVEAAAAEPLMAAGEGGEEADEQRLSREQLKDLAEAVETMSSSSALEVEREELEELEGERQAHKGAIEAAAAEDPQIRRLDKRVSTMIDKLRLELEGADETITAHVHQLDLDGDGVLSREEIELAMESIDLKKRPDAQQFEELFEKLDPDHDGKVSVADLHKLVKALEMRPETRGDEDDSMADDEAPSSREEKAKKEAEKRAKREAKKEAKKGGGAPS